VLETPVGAAACAAAVLPVAALALRARRDRLVLDVLRLPRPPGRVRAVAATSLAVAVLLAGLAAARPALEVAAGARMRTDAQAYVILDTSRSMAARAGPAAPTRLALARDAARALRDRVGDIPVGIASLSDRPLVHLFPTTDRDAFAAVLADTIGIDRPPPTVKTIRATDFDALVPLIQDRFFTAPRRVAVLVSDQETDTFDAAFVTAVLRKAHTTLLLLRIGGAGDRIRGEPHFHPDVAGVNEAERFAHGLGERVYVEHDVAALADRVRGALGDGTTAELPAGTRRIALGPWLVGLSALALALLAVTRYGTGLPVPVRRAGARGMQRAA